MPHHCASASVNASHWAISSQTCLTLAMRTGWVWVAGMVMRTRWVCSCSDGHDDEVSVQLKHYFVVKVAFELYLPRLLSPIFAVSWQVVSALWVALKWQLYVIFVFGDRAVLNTTLKMEMIGICFTAYLRTYVISQNITDALASVPVASPMCTAKTGVCLPNMPTERFMQVKISFDFFDFSMC